MSIMKLSLTKKKIINYILPFLTGFLFLCLFFAYLCYPPQYKYNWTNSMISRLGWPDQNPIGLIFFSIGFSVYGIGSLFFIQYLYRNLSTNLNHGSKLISILLFTGYIAIALIGLIPNYLDPLFMLIHGINAIIIFFNFYIVALIISLIIIRNMNSDNSQPKKKLSVLYILITIYGLLCTILLIYFMPKGQAGHYQQDPLLPFFISPPFYEWQAFIAIMITIYLLFVLLPEKS